MQRLMLLLSVVVGVVLAGCAGNGPAGPGQPGAVKRDGKSIELIAVKNARVFFHSSELDMNGGGCHRLRASGLGMDSADVAVIDFDRAALKAFLDKHAGKQVSARLVLAIRDLDKGPAKLEVATIDSGSDWNQGDKNMEQAGKGEVCASAAQFGVKPWTTPDGKAVKSLRELVFAKDKVKTQLNPTGVNVTDQDNKQSVSIDLTGEFVEHLANDANCRGIVVFTRTDAARVYFSSRDKEGKEPRLALSAK